MGRFLCKAEGKYYSSRFNKYNITKNLPGEQAFADKYNSDVALSNNRDLKL